MPESESYFGDPKSKLPDFKHTIDLVGELFSLGTQYSTIGLVSHFFLAQVETCPKEDTYAHMQRQALTIRLEIEDFGLG